jgi:hypothetical protein
MLQRVGRTVEEAEPHPITHRKLQLTVMVVVAALDILLGLEKTLLNLHQV